MQLVIAEKPSVAREIATLLGASEKQNGCLTGNGYCVTWALGHLVTLAMPEDYGIKGFQHTALPILPKPFLLTVRKERKGNGFVPDAGAAKQLKVMEHWMGQCSSIIVATDAGREGELIFRYIYAYLNCTLPFERLWISSLTEKAILQGFKKLMPGSAFDSLFAAAQSRSRADWLVGINASQALTIAAGSDIYSLGRVQTPTLAFICKRYLENKDFTVKHYWQIQLDHRKEFIDFKSTSSNKWDDKKLAENALKMIQREGTATVTDVQINAVEEQPPLLFDLTGLQKEANKKLNLSAEETLTIAQNLYEKKFITYPRTGSKYIPEDLWEEIPQLIRALDSSDRFRPATSKLKWGRFNKRIVNDVKVTDHHGLLTTEKIPSALPAKENAIYELVAYRLLEALSQPCNKDITDISLQALDYEFTIKGIKITEPGWRAIKGHFSDDEKEPLQDLPDLQKGGELKIVSARVIDKKTKPPALYTDGDLLSAMETAGNKTNNQQQKDALQGIGIGTPATRAGIIETLFKRQYIRREKKALIPTEKGLQVYHLVKDKAIADVAMTAEWEIALHKIEQSELDADTFKEEMEIYATNLTNELLKTSINMEQLPELKCPKCKTHHLMLRDNVVKCPDDACGWIQFRKVCGINISTSEIESLVVKGRTSLLRGMKSKAGNLFDAYIVMNEKGETSFEFNNVASKRGKQ